jgi:hypothetical protein
MIRIIDIDRKLKDNLSAYFSFFKIIILVWGNLHYFCKEDIDELLMKDFTGYQIQENSKEIIIDLFYKRWRKLHRDFLKVRFFWEYSLLSIILVSHRLVFQIGLNLQLEWGTFQYILLHPELVHYLHFSVCYR